MTQPPQIRALVIHCHPDPASFAAGVRDQVLADLDHAGAETRCLDLYAVGFDPVLSRDDLACYADPAQNRARIADEAADLAWCNTLIFVYPTWWYGLPAMLKGWLDRVLVPGLAFHLPDDGGPIRPGLVGIERLGVFTSGGAGWLLTRLIGAPGRRTLMRGTRPLCAPRCRRGYAMHYRMDRSTPQSRARHLRRVRRVLARLIA